MIYCLEGFVYMRITAINGGMFFNRTCKNTLSNRTPSFQADYDNKPVPPQGKVVAAASVLALLAAMTNVSKCDNDVYNDPEPAFEILSDTLERSNYHQPMENEDTMPKKTVNVRAVETNTTPVDSLSQDSVKVIDSLGITKDSIYKLISNGDSVIIEPVSRADYVDSMHKRH